MVASLNQLLDCRLKDLPLENVKARLSRYQFLLHKELRAKGLSFDFHIWVSDDWFCPDGVPGFAVPFYLFNQKLMRLHKKHLGFIEGTTERQILKLMRHELGHAIDNAFSLRKNKERQKVFGSSQKEYPINYSPQAYSRKFVHYLGDNYAQSHPDEDFAETFAYWLDPEKKWKQIGSEYGAFKKLQLMDQLMANLRGRKTVLKNKYRIEPIENNKTRLSQHYGNLKKQRNVLAFARVDQSLKNTFAGSKSGARAISLSNLEKPVRQQFCRQISVKTGSHQYEAQRALKKIIERAESLGIKATSREWMLKTPSLIERNYRYLKENNLLKYYL